MRTDKEGTVSIHFIESRVKTNAHNTFNVYTFHIPFTDLTPIQKTSKPYKIISSKVWIKIFSTKSFISFHSLEREWQKSMRELL